MNHPIAGAHNNIRELTLRGMILGALITFVFTASNVYLGLKVGLTFSSSIPAAVISMGVLRFFKGSNILEHNMVQTQASAAGCLSAVIFLLPAMLMLGYWQGFPVLETMLLCAAGGCLGVLFTIPLRYVMVVSNNLPYPEGLAAAEILKSGAEAHPQEAADTPPTAKGSVRHAGKEITFGGVFAGIVSLLSGGFKVIADSTAYWFSAGAAIFQIPLGFSLALLGAGYLIGIAAGIAILIGTILAWGVGVPIFSLLTDATQSGNLEDVGSAIWAQKVRMIGVGTIAVASVWTLITLFKPMIAGFKLTFSKTSRAQDPDMAAIGQDLSPRLMSVMALILTLVLGGILYSFAAQMNISTGMQILLAVVTTVLVVVMGFLVASACGYMAGLIGTSSSPISGIGIIGLVVIASVLYLIGKYSGINDLEDGKAFLTALTILSVSILICIAAISNDNLQDLKTGQLVGATPWCQEIALLIGCVAGAIVIAPVLDLLYQAYGFTGATPRADMDPSQVLSAPQATLMSTLAQGIFDSSLEWSYILIGAGLCVLIIIIDVLLKKGSADRMALPPLAVGLGIYLPPEINVPMVFGAILSWLIVRHVRHYARSHHADEPVLQARVKQRATLFAAGLIVGESLIGVIMAFIIVASVTSGGSDAPLSLVGADWQYGGLLGLLVFIVAVLVFAWRTIRAKRAS